MYYITKILEFDAGHRVLNHESKCANFHGHRYKAECCFTNSSLDDIGRIIDFSCIKAIVGKWIDDNWDHTMILHILDKKFGDILQTAGNKKVYYMQKNPTAENMSKYLFYKANELLSKQRIKCVEIKLWETPTAFAVFKELPIL